MDRAAGHDRRWEPPPRRLGERGTFHAAKDGTPEFEVVLTGEMSTTSRAG
ncbi:MAG: hypothetical protein ABSH07_02395 [Candidatus Dormibacteria bacterium]